jgi:hypothetical protein
LDRKDRLNFDLQEAAQNQKEKANKKKKKKKNHAHAYTGIDNMIQLDTNLISAKDEQLLRP